MDPFLLAAEAWWWVVPVAAGAGAGAYGMLTTKKRRARRLELDAARHEEGLARRELAQSSLQVKSAKAEVLAAKAQYGATSPAFAQARRALNNARDMHRSASLALRAARGHVKASSIRYHTMARDAVMPIDELIARHDALTARWMVYETDAATALSYPQMLDAQHPATLAFLRAQRGAQELRGRASQGDVTPEVYLAYRNAVRDAEVAFETAEADARGEVRERYSGLGWSSMTPIADWIPRAADAIEHAARVVGEVRDMAPQRKPAGRSGDRSQNPPSGTGTPRGDAAG
ncbi:hypothetical protein [Microbacterium sp. C7(2022)]|uniref:hypothetical protein n=1 Tax=Microbacterium sp. C7(2022) TaxID=2992759 RepID=UPI00237B292F|nr:hypothetical protein [Microbacterium sp. C7(2022)]MDE0545064.1 hypothetical protein [Microbacterium sp. C7(2022)]